MNNIVKRIIRVAFILIVFSGAFSGLNAQPSSPQQDRIRQKIRTHKIAFITDRLALTEREAEKFWPLYREYENEKKSLKEDKLFKEWKDEMTDQDADKWLENMMDRKEKELDLEKKYVSKFKTVLSSKKVIKLFKAERDFKSKMVEHIKGRPGKRPKP